MQAEQTRSLWQATSPVGRKPRAARLCRHRNRQERRTPLTFGSASDPQSPPGGGVGGRRTSRTGRAQRPPVPSLCAPWGAEVGTKAQRPLERFCPHQGGRNIAWQPSGARGQSSGDAVSAAALTGPRAAAQTGAHFRPIGRELWVAWTPRRHCLGGVSHGVAVDDGRVGPLARSTERFYRCLP
jgi:hypothetical protein